MIDANKIANEIVEEILKEEGELRKKVVVYSGRFQPFHSGHYKTYKHLIDKFGRENVYIGTSNKVSKPKSPFTFKEKKKIITQMFRIPSNKIVEVKNPYAPKEILKNFDKNTTAYITVVGDKDKNRLGGSYFEKYKDNISLESYADKGYVYVAPNLSDISGTDVRNKLGEPSTSIDVKEVEFKRIYGSFDKRIFDLITDRLTESVVLEWILERKGKLFEIPKSDVIKIDNYADKQLNPIDIDLTGRHFFDRLNDPRNKRDISTYELMSFFRRLKKDKKKFIEFLKKYRQIVVTDKKTDINIPFMKKANKAIAKTVMRKHNFKTSNKRIAFEDTVTGGLADNMSLSDIAAKHRVSIEQIRNQMKMGIEVEMEHTDSRDIAIEIAKDHLVEDPSYYTKLKRMENEEKKYKYWEPALGGGITEGILNEGGAYGHMNHPFDLEINLTFGDLKNIVNLALEGKLELAREKTDGMALAVSWRDDRGGLIAARNKSHLKNSGINAMDIEDVKDKFSGRGGLTDAYTYAMHDLQQAISKLSDKQREEIFQNGKSFMNIEVIFPESINVIPYGQSLLVFHGTMQYDDNGNPIGENQKAGRKLAEMVKKINQDVQKYYNLQGPPIQKLPKSEDLSKKKPVYLKAIKKLQNEFNLKDSDGVGEYHQAWWENWVEKNAPKTLDNRTKMHLVKRWAFNDKSNRLNGKEIEDKDVLKWAKKMDKQKHDKIAKENLQKFENIFLALGAEVLSYMSSVLTVNPDKAVQKIKDRLDKTIKDIRKSGDPSNIDKLEKELKRLQDAGGTDMLVPNEGIVFVYKGNTLKLTGTFAPLNQILGMMYR